MKRFITLFTALIIGAGTAGYGAVEGDISGVYAEETEEELVYQDIPVSRFEVDGLSPNSDTELDYTDWWYSEWDDCRYIFLPAMADRAALTVVYETESGEPVCLGGKEVVSGEVTDIFDTADEFEVTVGGVDCGTLKIMQSELGCVFIATESGTIDNLDSHKSMTETGDTLMLNADGGVEYSGEIEKLKSHGNSSWDYANKKPYNLKLPKKQNLYGMGKAKKWCLLSNYIDHSMLRNYATSELSRASGMEYVMDSVFVDLYADGSYRGTYQLCERVQIQKNRVNITDLEEKTEALNENDLETYAHIAVGADSVSDFVPDSYKYYDIPNDPDDITGGYLLQLQLYNRYGTKSESGFVTSRGQAVEIDGPEYASLAQVLYIRQFIQEFEDAIYSENGYNSLGKHYSDYIDTDSLVKAYLAKEISMDADGTSTSFYMWKDSDKTGDGKLHFSPVWDFDLAYGNYYRSRQNSEGDSGGTILVEKLYAACFPMSGYDSSNEDCKISGIDWVGQLYHHSAYFRNRTAAIYFECFEPYLTSLTDNSEGECELRKMADKMQFSAEMNNARWHMFGKNKPLGPVNGNNFDECVEYLRSFAAKRKNGLAELWKELAAENCEYGDANLDGEVTVADCTLIMQSLSAHDAYRLADDGRRYADVTGGGDGVTAEDALTVQKYLSGAVESLPVG